MGRSMLEGYHPVLTPLRDANEHLQQAAEATAGVNPATLRRELAQAKHWLALIEAKLPAPLNEPYKIYELWPGIGITNIPWDDDWRVEHRAK